MMKESQIKNPEILKTLVVKAGAGWNLRGGGKPLVVDDSTRLEEARALGQNDSEQVALHLGRSVLDGAEAAHLTDRR